jgi:hypothetical protein
VRTGPLIARHLRNPTWGRLGMIVGPDRVSPRADHNGCIVSTSARRKNTEFQSLCSVPIKEMRGGSVAASSSLRLGKLRGESRRKQSNA